MVDLTFINSSVHRRLVTQVLQEAQWDDEIIGLFLQGSVVRGDGYDTSDLDLYALLNDGLNRQFRSEYREGILVEFKYSDFERASSKCKNTPMEMYNFIDAAILFDQQGKLKQLKDLAQALFEQYRTPPSELNSIAYWLESALLKIKAAKSAEDELKASFVVSTTSWQIIEGIWAVNNRPVPPNGSVLYHLRDLTIVPTDVETQIHHLFAGDATARIDAAIDITEWVIVGLSK